MKYSIDEIAKSLIVIKDTCEEYHRQNDGENCPFCLGSDCDDCGIVDYGFSPCEWKVTKKLKVTCLSRP